MAAKVRKNGEKFLWILPASISFCTESLSYGKILWNGTDGFIPPQKEVVLCILIAFTNPSFLPGYEAATIRYNGKHANH
jgi:hypothetical protein